jgi:16S rRNA (guanine527-N7)-methyltransferase
MEDALQELGHRDRELAPRLAALVELVFAWSSRINLTGHQDRDAIARELVLDALGLASLMPEQGDLVDVGSGAGFPGLPIALSRPRNRVTLIDSREKRHHFQRTAIRELSIQNAEARLGRAELLKPTPHRIAVARAAGPIQEVVPWLLPWLEPGGLALVPIRAGGRAPEIEGVVTLGVRSYAPPLTGRERWVWVGRKPASAPS